MNTTNDDTAGCGWLVLIGLITVLCAVALLIYHFIKS